MQSGNFNYLSSGKPTMKSAIGYFRWLQSFQLGIGSNLYIISRRRLGLVRVWRRYSDFKPWPPLLQIFLTASKNSASWNHRSGVISVTQNFTSTWSCGIETHKFLLRLRRSPGLGVHKRINHNAIPKLGWPFQKETPQRPWELLHLKINVSIGIYFWSVVCCL